MTADETLNELLVCLFKDLTEIEGRCLITDEFSDISINDMHIIEAIGVDEPKRSGTVAKLMSITLGTLTKAIDGLTRKGYVNRIRSEEDKRVVKLSLTDKGKSAYYHHEQFHRHMIEHIKDDLSDDEMKVLITSLAKLSDYEGAVGHLLSDAMASESWQQACHRLIGREEEVSATVIRGHAREQ